MLPKTFLQAYKLLSKVFVFSLTLNNITYCGDAHKLVSTDENIQDSLIYLQNFEHQTTNEQGKTDWQLKAQKAAFFQDNISSTYKRLYVYDFNFIQYISSSQEVNFELEAQQGRFDKEKKLLYLTGKIIFQDNKKRKMYADYMEYDLKTKLLKSDKQVWLKEDGITTLCRKGLIWKLNSSQQNCKSPLIYGQNILEKETFKEIFN